MEHDIKQSAQLQVLWRMRTFLSHAGLSDRVRCRVWLAWVPGVSKCLMIAILKRINYLFLSRYLPAKYLGLIFKYIICIWTVLRL